MIARPLVIGMLSYGIARLSNPEASSWRALGVTLAFIFVMFINDVWRQVSRDRYLEAMREGISGN